MLDRLEKLFTILGVILTLVIAGVAGLAYQASVHHEQVNRTFELFVRYTTGDVLEGRRGLREAVRDLLAITDESGNRLSVSELEQVMIEKMTTGKDLRNYDLVIELLDAVYTCSDSKACDKETT